MQIASSLQLATQSTDQHLDDVGITLLIIGVQLLHEPILGYHLLMVAHQILENPVLEGRKGYRLLVNGGLPSVQVQHQGACLDLRLNKAGSAAYQGIQTGLQFLELEGLDHIVVGAGGQPLDLVLPVASGRQDEDGEAAIHAAQFADQVQSAHAGQSQIDNGNIMVVLLGAVQPLLRIGHCIDDMPQLRKTRRQVVTQQRLVFDQQQLHVTLRGRTDAYDSAL